MSVCGTTPQRTELTEIDCNDTQERAGVPKTSIEAWRIGVDVRRSLTDENAEQDEGANPRVLFKSMDEAEPKD